MVQTYRPLNHETLREQVVQRIQEALLTGHLRPGDRIVELDLAQQWGVSRAPIREAIRDLTSQGILTNSTRRGTFVASWSVKSLVELYSLRATLEGKAARLVALSILPENSARLRSIVASLQTAVADGDPVGIARQDLSFHHAVLEMSGHEQLQRMWTQLGAFAPFLLARPHPQLSDLVERHELLIGALESGDPARAEQAFQRQILGMVLKEYGLSEEDVRTQVSPAVAMEVLAMAV